MIPTKALNSKVGFKPAWLNKKVNLSLNRHLKATLRSLKLHTVCEESGCPNISECFSRGSATFLILGNSCTRNCTFCAVSKAKPQPMDSAEPKRVAQAAKDLNLNYLVVTSPTRDDLSDGGAGHFAKTVEAIRALDSKPQVEILIPDFLGKRSSLEKVAVSQAKVIAHNLETVSRLYKDLRPEADYRRSLLVLKTIKQFNPEVSTKSGLMLGLGEEEDEVKQVLADLRSVDCDFLTLGQYLPPSRQAYPLQKYILPEIFSYFKQYALKLGFKAVLSGPYVRSSYQAHVIAST